MNEYWYTKARHALVEGLSCNGAKRGDEILIPSYICEIIPRMLEHHGYKIFYYEIDDSFAPDLLSIEKICSKKNVKVLLLVHYFGIPVDINKLHKIIAHRSVKIIEDCTHLLPPKGYLQLKNINSHFIIYSPRKILNTSNGGLLVTTRYLETKKNNNRCISDKVKIYLYQIYNNIGIKFLRIKIKVLISCLFKKNIYQFSSETLYLKIKSLNVENCKILNKNKWDEIHKLRQKNKESWLNYLSDKNFIIPKEFKNSKATSWAMPLYSNDFESKNKLIRLCLMNNINIFSWPNLPKEIRLSNEKNLLRWKSLLVIELNKPAPFY